MDEVLRCLELKNHYYEKFYSVTSKFIEQTNKNDWDNLDFFVDNRERILNIIRSFDFQVSKAFKDKNLNLSQIEQYQPQVKLLLEKRADWAAKIVALDLELISKIDEMKSDTIKDLKKTMDTQHRLNSFAKSSPPRKSTKNA